MFSPRQIVLLPIAAALALLPAAANAQAIVRHFWDFEGENPYLDKIGQAHGSITDTSTVLIFPGRSEQGKAANTRALVTGNNDLIRVDSSELHDPASGSFSFTGWFRLAAETANNRGIFDFSGNGGDSGPQMLLTSAKSLNFRVDGVGPYNLVSMMPAAGIQYDAWHFFAAVYDPALETDTLKFYFNDSVPAATASRGTAVPTSTKPLTSWLGTFNFTGIGESKGLDGDLDELAYFSGALTEDQIAGLLAGTLSPGDMRLPAGDAEITAFEHDRVTRRSSIRFTSATGNGYQVWGCDDLVSWEKLTTEPIPGTGDPIDFSHVPGASQFYYQIRTVPN